MPIQRHGAPTDKLKAKKTPPPGTSNERAECQSRVLKARHAAEHSLSHNCFEGSAHVLRLKPMGTEDRAARYTLYEQ